MAIMSNGFDVYHKWLSIPPNEQPPNHYRLLGLGLFESDPDVISAAADRQMSHVQTYKNGPQADLSQRLLNEIASAKLCLLKPPRKMAYDTELRQTLAAKQPAAAPVPAAASAPVMAMAGSAGSGPVPLPPPPIPVPPRLDELDSEPAIGFRTENGISGGSDSHPAPAAGDRSNSETRARFVGIIDRRYRQCGA